MNLILPFFVLLEHTSFHKNKTTLQDNFKTFYEKYASTKNLSRNKGTKAALEMCLAVEERSNP